MVLAVGVGTLCAIGLLWQGRKRAAAKKEAKNQARSQATSQAQSQRATSTQAAPGGEREKKNNNNNEKGGKRIDGKKMVPLPAALVIPPSPEGEVRVVRGAKTPRKTPRKRGGPPMWDGGKRLVRQPSTDQRLGELGFGPSPQMVQTPTPGAHKDWFTAPEEMRGSFLMASQGGRHQLPTVPAELGVPDQTHGWYRVVSMESASVFRTMWFDYDEVMNAWYWTPYDPKVDFLCWMCTNNVLVRRGRLTGLSPSGKHMAIIGYLYRNNPSPPGRDPVSAHTLIRSHRIRVQIREEAAASEARRKHMLARAVSTVGDDNGLADWSSFSSASSSSSSADGGENGRGEGELNTYGSRGSFVDALGGLGYAVEEMGPTPGITMENLDSYILRGISYQDVDDVVYVSIAPAESPAPAPAKVPARSKPVLVHGKVVHMSSSYEYYYDEYDFSSDA